MKARSRTVKSRCPNGLNLLADRARAVNQADMETWNIIEANGYLLYMQHEKRCPTCRAYYKQRIKARYRKIK